MRTIYIDSDFKCHTSNDGTMAAVKTDFFDDKCDVFVEGYRFIPAGRSWKRSDGVVFHGEMITPWVNYDRLIMAQLEADNNTLTAQVDALSFQLDFQEECLVEMAGIIYA